MHSQFSQSTAFDYFFPQNLSSQSQSMFVIILWKSHGTIVVDLQKFVDVYLLYVIGVVIGAKVSHHQVIIVHEVGYCHTKYNNSAISNLDCKDKIYLDNTVFIIKYINIFQNKPITGNYNLLLLFQIWGSEWTQLCYLTSIYLFQIMCLVNQSL